MRRVLSTIAACVLFAVPAAVLPQESAQHQHQTPQQPNVRPIPPNTRTIPPVKRPRPMPTGRFARRPNQRNQNSYPVVIDGNVINRYLATPGPGPKHTPAPRAKNYGQDVFETHSSDDAK